MNTNKLSIRLLWYITPVVLLPLLFLGGFTLSNVTASSQQQTQTVVSRFVEQQQNKVFHSFNMYHASTKLLTSSPLLQAFIDEISSPSQQYTPATAQVMDVFHSYTQAYPNIQSIDFISTQGASYAYYSARLAAKSPTYPFFEQLKNSDELQSHYIVVDQEQPRLYFTQKVYDEHHQFERPALVGYIIIQVTPKVLFSATSEAPLNDASNIVVSAAGQVLFSSNPDWVAKQLSDSEMDALTASANNGKLDSLTLGSLLQKSRMYYVVKMHSGNYFATGIPKAMQYESIKAISLITGLMIALSCVILPTLIFIVVRNLLLNPIEALGEASRNVASNNLSVRLPNDRHDEVGALYTDFNHMIHTIDKTQAQVEDYKNTLEQKVETRTLELEKTNQALERAIEQAEQANRLKSRFLANMSHEIRTPLTAIMGFSEHILEADKISDPQARNHLATILRNSRHLLELINNILDLSKIEAEKLDINLEQVLLIDIIDDINAIIEPLATQKGLDYKVELTFPLPQYVITDATRIKQIMLNILTNAIKFTSQGFVSLSIEFKNDYLYWHVCDSGIGISDVELSRIFKPFEQADSTTTRRFGGSGLGLCIAKNLTNLLQGDINVSSIQGEGSCFDVYIVVTDSDSALTLCHSEAELKPATERNETMENLQFEGDILIAEDNADNRDLLALMLSRWGIAPDFATNGAQAVEMALVTDYQLILMDMQMPVMGGEEATRMLRHAAYDGPIIALTANVMQSDVARYLEAGCDQALAKPIDLTALENTLAKYLSLAQEQDKQWDSLLNSKRFAQITLSYKQKLPQYKQEVEQHLDAKEWEQLQALAHSIKGSAGCFAFHDIALAADHLEQVLKQGPTEDNQEAAKHLVAAIEQGLQEE